MQARRCIWQTLVVAVTLCATPLPALPSSYRDHHPPPLSYDGPPLPPPPPAFLVPAAPPPPSPAMRAIYAPFYAAGLVLHYGWIYGVEAPIYVFHRALHFGVEDDVADRR